MLLAITVVVVALLAAFLLVRGPLSGIEKLPVAVERRVGTDRAGGDAILAAAGGRVWAEGAPGQGAAFFFTLAPRRPAA